MTKFAKAAKDAREMTNKQLATEIAALSTSVSRDRLEELLPMKRDKEEFLELMRVVEAETAIDEKLAFLRENLETAGKVALKALQVFI
jgi:hypothetical protein